MTPALDLIPPRRSKEDRLIERLKSRTWDEIGVRDAILFVGGWTSATKLVLLALVSFRGRDGTSRAGHRALAKLAGVHRETAIASLKSLAEAGYVRVSRPGPRNAPSIVDLSGLPTHLVNALVAAKNHAVVELDDHAVVELDDHAVVELDDHAVVELDDHERQGLSGVVGSENHERQDPSVVPGSENHGVAGSGSPCGRIECPPVAGLKHQKESGKENTKESDQTPARDTSPQNRNVSSWQLELATALDKALVEIPRGDYPPASGFAGGQTQPLIAPNYPTTSKSKNARELANAPQPPREFQQGALVAVGRR